MHPNTTAGPARELGLRERKKERTRQAIIDAAMTLYRERGYEGVTVAEIARIADIAPRTFFLYFESKEDVFLVRGDDRWQRLVLAITERDRGEPILMAVQGVLRHAGEQGDESRPVGMSRIGEFLRYPAVADRLRERWNHWEDRIAEAIATDVGASPGDPEPRVVAAALCGAIRVAAAAADEQPTRRQEIAARVFDLLATGLSAYGAEAHGSGQ